MPTDGTGCMHPITARLHRSGQLAVRAWSGFYSIRYVILAFVSNTTASVREHWEIMFVSSPL